MPKPQPKMREARIAAGMRQLDLAWQIEAANPNLHVSEGDVSRWEHGRALPSKEVKRMIKHVLSVEYEE